MDPPAVSPTRFDRVEARLRRLAVTMLLWLTVLAGAAEVVAYIVALVNGQHAPPPLPLPAPKW
jgi:hypothetical protein